MARRLITTDRLIAALGVAVLLLGGAVLWLATHDPGFGRDPTPLERVAAQIRDRDPRLIAAYTQAGRTEGVVCGFTGLARPGTAPDPRRERFISRRSRIMFETDPLRREFDDQFARECSGFLRDPRTRPAR